MPDPTRRLLPGEVVVDDIRPHWWYLSGPVAAVVVVLVGAASAMVEGAARRVDLVVGVLLVAALVRLVARYARWARTHLVVTTARLIDRRGVVVRRRREIPIEHLADVGVRQTLWQRLVGAGDLLLRPAGGDSREVFPWLPHPGSIRDQLGALVEQGRRERGPSVADEIERLDGLRRRGVLSPAEFEAEKVRVLGR